MLFGKYSKAPLLLILEKEDLVKTEDEAMQNDMQYK